MSGRAESFLPRDDGKMHVGIITYRTGHLKIGNFEHHLPNLAKNRAVENDHPCSRKIVPLDIEQKLEQYSCGIVRSFGATGR